MRDLATTVETIVDENDTGLHILDMSLAIEPGADDPYQRAFVNIMGTIAQLEADMIRERTRSGIEAARQAGKHTGRPPFGFDVADGYLTPNEDYDVAVEILERIEKGESKRSTARFAGVSRPTIDRILKRKTLYREGYATALLKSAERDKNRVLHIERVFSRGADTQPEESGDRSIQERFQSVGGDSDTTM